MSKANELSLKIAGRNLTPQEVSRLAVLREAMGIRETDALMPLTVLLMQQEALWHTVPEQIKEAGKASAEDARMQAEVVMAEAVKSASPQLAQRISAEIGKRMEGVTDSLRYKWMVIALLLSITLVIGGAAAGWFLGRMGEDVKLQNAFESGIAWCQQNPAKCGRK